MNNFPRCKTCKYFTGDSCDYVEWDDLDYPHNNSAGMGIIADAHDNSGMIISLRVDEDFGCIKHIF